MATLNWIKKLEIPSVFGMPTAEDSRLDGSLIPGDRIPGDSAATTGWTSDVCRNQAINPNQAEQKIISGKHSQKLNWPFSLRSLLSYVSAFYLMLSLPDRNSKPKESPRTTLLDRVTQQFVSLME